MPRPLLGQILCEMGKLSTIDIDEILEQQAVSHGRFGEIAMSWGLCEAVDVCEAWCIQFAEGFDWPDLSHCEIDAKVILAVPGELARQLHIVPKSRARRPCHDKTLPAALRQSAVSCLVFFRPDFAAARRFHD